MQVSINKLWAHNKQDPGNVKKISNNFNKGNKIEYIGSYTLIWQINNNVSTFS